MNDISSLLLIGVGGAGCSMVRSVIGAFGASIRHLLVDTDATTGIADGVFSLIGGNRLSGRGAGGDIVAARLAAAESVQTLDESIGSARLAVVVTALGGGTGGGGTLELLRHLKKRGIPTVVFATTPFAFEGENRLRNARNVMAMIEETANATFFLPLDTLVAGIDNMDEALRSAIDTVATGVTFFWRMLEKPGYIRLSVENLRHLIAGAGRGRFATFSVEGPDRASRAVEAIARSPLLATGTAPVKTILCGLLAGSDLRLSEIGEIAEGARNAYGKHCTFELATVNDEATFSGRLVIVILLLESSAREDQAAEHADDKSGGRHRQKSALAAPTSGRGRFQQAQPTVWHGEDLDIPTFIRECIQLDF